MEKQKNAVGRRKEAVTRVFLSKGQGNITVNDKTYKEYFSLQYLQNQVELPLKTIQALDKYDVKINAAGLADKAFAGDIIAKGADIQEKAMQAEAEILSIVNSKIGG